MLLLCFLTSFVPFVCCDGGVAFSLFSLSAWRRPPPCRDHRPRGSRSCHLSVGPPSPSFLRRPSPSSSFLRLPSPSSSFLRRPSPSPSFLRLPSPSPPHQLPYPFPHSFPYSFPHSLPYPLSYPLPHSSPLR